MDNEFKIIPETSPKHYISGWEALNTPTEDRTTADWHPYVYWLATKNIRKSHYIRTRCLAMRE